MHLHQARLQNEPEHYLLYVQSMHLAFEQDPNNYFYYSVFFEKLVELFRSPHYLARPISRHILIHSMLDALNHYVRLKDFYAERYLLQLCSTLNQVEKRLALGRSDLELQIRKALESY